MPAKITMGPLGGKGALLSHHKRTPGIRGECRGWSVGASRRNRDFLNSIIPGDLDGHGVSFSLTVRDIPENAEAWERLRGALLDRLRRMGLKRFHWVTEWQERGAPHLHGIAYFVQPQEVMACWVVHHWLQVSAPYGSGYRSQDAKGVPRLSGWLQYLTKHGSRTASNRQRLLGAMPPGWEKAGRLWGKGGEWPVRSQAVECDEATLFAYRRILRRHAAASARSALVKARGTEGEAKARRWVTVTENAGKWVGRIRPGEPPLTPAQRATRSRMRGAHGYLGDADVDRWLHQCVREWWGYIEEAEATEPPRPALSIEGCRDGGAGQ